MFKSKFLKVGILSSLMLLALSSASYASTWKQEEDGAWRFIRNNGGYAVESWAQSGSDWYYMDADGYVTKSTLIELGNHTYYLKADGVMAKNEWVSFDNEEVPAEPIWYYFGEDGRAYKGRENRVIPRVIGDKSFAFDTTGHMLRGFVTESGERVEDQGNNYEFLEAMYYFGEDGAMYQNQWLRYNDVGRDSVVSQLAQRPYSEYGELWLYFGEKGKKLTAHSLEKVRVRTINGATYSFDEHGVMIPRLFGTDASIPASYSNATIRYGHLDTSGNNIGDYWSYMVPNEEMSEKDYHEQKFSWFRTNPNGTVIKDRIATVLGRKYAFDEIGRMQSGFVIMENNGTFGMQFDIDAFSTTDFKDGTLGELMPLLDRGKLYLFGTDELNDGSMRYGTEVNVIMNDGEATIGIASNGVVYGNRSKLQKANKKFYINGLLLQANSENGYGIVINNTGTNPIKYVVDTSGRIRENKKAIFHAADGSWILIQNGKFFARVEDGEKPRWATKRGVTGFWRYDSSLKGDARFVELITESAYGENYGDGFLLYAN